MNWSRDKNSSEEKTVHREILLHVGLGGGNLNNELDSKQYCNSSEEKAVNGKIYCMFSFGGEV